MLPLFDLTTQYRTIREEVRAAVDQVLDHAHYILGPEVAEFEKNFARYCGVRHAIGVNSGTSALHLAVLAAGIGQGDEVITVPFTFVATAAAIRYAGATPVFVDIDPRTLTMDPTQLEAAITPRTKAIMPVHIYGHPADMDPICAVARKHNLVVIEDCAQAHGATYKGRAVGSIGDYGCFSFYPSKNLGACGEGGMVVTNDDTANESVRLLRDWGQKTKGIHDLKAFNYRLEGIQGAILDVKLRHLPKWTEQRRSHAAYYNQALAGLDMELPFESSDAKHVYHLYVVRVDNREAWMKDLASQGLGSGIHYALPVHLQPAHQDLNYARGSFPVSERACETVVSIPMFPELTPEQLDFAAATLRKTREAHRSAPARA
jgi:dTDP-4-amino-4,6-dideoxygalactose transaminase